MEIVANMSIQGATGSSRGQVDKEQEFQEAVGAIEPKIASNSKQVTEEDANLLHSTESRAYGVTEKGGITAQAQHLAAENKGATK